MFAGNIKRFSEHPLMSERRTWRRMVGAIGAVGFGRGGVKQVPDLPWS